MENVPIDRIELIRSIHKDGKDIVFEDVSALFDHIDYQAARLAELDGELTKQIAEKVSVQAKAEELEATVALAMPAPVAPLVTNEVAARRHDAAKEERQRRAAERAARDAAGTKPLPPDVGRTGK